jgi:uncharacterized coiled-coil DUF342 family protein
MKHLKKEAIQRIEKDWNGKNSDESAESLITRAMKKLTEQMPKIPVNMKIVTPWTTIFINARPEELNSAVKNMKEQIKKLQEVFAKDTDKINDMTERKDVYAKRYYDISQEHDIQVQTIQKLQKEVNQLKETLKVQNENANIQQRTITSKEKEIETAKYNISQLEKHLNTALFFLKPKDDLEADLQKILNKEYKRNDQLKKEAEFYKSELKAVSQKCQNQKEEIKSLRNKIKKLETTVTINPLIWNVDLDFAESIKKQIRGENQPLTYTDNTKEENTNSKENCGYLVGKCNNYDSRKPIDQPEQPKKDCNTCKFTLGPCRDIVGLCQKTDHYPKWKPKD